MHLEAAILNQNIANGNIYLLNQQQNQQIQGFPTFLPSQQLISPANQCMTQSPNNLMDLFDTNNEQQFPNENRNRTETIYDTTEMENMNGEQEPMLANHYASSGLLMKEQANKQDNLEEERQLL